MLSFWKWRNETHRGCDNVLLTTKTESAFKSLIFNSGFLDYESRAQTIDNSFRVQIQVFQNSNFCLKAQILSLARILSVFFHDRHTLYISEYCKTARGRQTLKVAPMIFSWYLHLYTCIISWWVWAGPVIASDPQNMAKVMGCTWLCYIAHFAEDFPSLAGLEEATKSY